MRLAAQVTIVARRRLPAQRSRSSCPSRSKKGSTHVHHHHHHAHPKSSSNARTSNHALISRRELAASRLHRSVARACRRVAFCESTGHSTSNHSRPAPPCPAAHARDLRRRAPGPERGVRIQPPGSYAAPRLATHEMNCARARAREETLRLMHPAGSSDPPNLRRGTHRSIHRKMTCTYAIILDASPRRHARAESDSRAASANTANVDSAVPSPGAAPAWRARSELWERSLLHRARRTLPAAGPTGVHNHPARSR
ncbi:hypothetical protein BC628DRAFT_655610 [Trametes gibbosa]|nr:hypothetical protein BC628DRAFT_655610 [Trametes gibbosa]